MFVGPSGLRQVHAAAHDRRPRGHHGGQIVIGGTVVNDLPPRARDIAMVFQDYALYPHKTVFENMAFGLQAAQASRARDPHARRRGGGDPADRAPLRAQAARALGRAAPARRDGARDRAQAEGVPVRRAAVEPRRAAARRDARRDQEAAPEARQHDRLRDARPGRGDDARRSHRRAAGGQPDPVRHARRHLQPAGGEVRRGLHRLAADEFPAVPRRRGRAHAAPAGRRRPAGACARASPNARGTSAAR